MHFDTVRTKRLMFDQATSGDHVVVPGVEEKRVKIKSMFLCAMGNQTVTIRSNSTVLATLPLPANGIINLSMILGNDRYFETDEGAAFIINLSASIRFTGFLVYEQS